MLQTIGERLIELSPRDLLTATAEIWQRQEGTRVQPELAAIEEDIQQVWKRYHPRRIHIPHSFLSRYGSILRPPDLREFDLIPNHRDAGK